MRRDDLVEQLRHALAGLGRDAQHLVAGDAEHLLDLAGVAVGIRRGEVDLVQRGDDLEVVLEREVAVGERLGLDALARRRRAARRPRRPPGCGSPRSRSRRARECRSGAGRGPASATRTFCALIVIPRSRSMSIESRYWARMSRGSTAPVSSRMRSESVDLPWSTWLMMEKLRMRAGSITPPWCHRRAPRPAAPACAPCDRRSAARRQQRNAAGSRSCAGRCVDPPGRRSRRAARSRRVVGALLQRGRVFGVVGPRGAGWGAASVSGSRLDLVVLSRPLRSSSEDHGEHQESDQAHRAERAASRAEQGRALRAEDADQERAAGDRERRRGHQPSASSRRCAGSTRQRPRASSTPTRPPGASLA